ncbi:RNA-directed DNA polymerase from mobile element jockey [Trichonephila clavipes]|nr:RNA-directed DNA polymerase from mobile element jockey [Trichonephila clavipes]
MATHLDVVTPRVQTINNDPMVTCTGHFTAGGSIKFRDNRWVKVRDLTQKQWKVDNDDGSLWGLARSFKKKRSPIPTLKGHTTIAYSDTEKVETLADSLENQFKLNDISNPQHDKNHTRLVSRFFTNDNNFDDNPTNPKPSEILTYINKLKIRKTPGREGISNKMGKDPTLPESFRPISLLPILSKLAEKIIQNRLCLNLNANDILINQQHGLRVELSTSHQFLRVLEYIKTGFKDRKSTGTVFLDIQKTFDGGQFQKIHNDKSIAEEDKMQFLLQSVEPKSKAERLVLSFPATAEIFPKAIDQLKEGYGREYLLVQIYVRELLSLVMKNAVSE